jgi:hypothetical protein
MRQLLKYVGILILLLGVAGPVLLQAAAPPVRQKKKEKGPPAGKAVALPNMRFQHQDRQRRTRTFVLEGKSGTADYYPGGVRRKDKLVFVRRATIGPVSGWVYQVEREGKKRPVWLFFASKPTITRGGKKLYLVLYTVRPPDMRGKQWWQPLPPPLGAVGTPLEKEKPADA